MKNGTGHWRLETCDGALGSAPPHSAAGPRGPAAIARSYAKADSDHVQHCTGTVPVLYRYCLDGFEVRLCDPCVSRVRPRVPCVSRVCPGSPRCLFTGTVLYATHLQRDVMITATPIGSPTYTVGDPTIEEYVDSGQGATGRAEAGRGRSRGGESTGQSPCQAAKGAARGRPGSRGNNGGNTSGCCDASAATRRRSITS